MLRTLCAAMLTSSSKLLGRASGAVHVAAPTAQGVVRRFVQARSQADAFEFNPDEHAAATVMLKGRLAGAFMMHNAPSGAIARAPLIVTHNRGEDQYEMEIYGEATTNLSGLQPNDHVAVEGSLRLEKINDSLIPIVEAYSVVKALGVTSSAPKRQYNNNNKKPAGSPGYPSTPNASAPIQAPPQQANMRPGTGRVLGAGSASPPPTNASRPAVSNTPRGPSPQGNAPQQGGGGAGKMDNSWLATATTEEKWRHVESTPNAWFDNRTTKTNPKAPDFKLKGKDVNVALWITSKDTPQWAVEQFKV